MGCQDPENNPGKICLEGFKGCFLPEELRPINTLVSTFYTLGGAVGQIFGAIKDDVGEAWQDLKVGLSAFASSVSNKITDARAKVAEKLNFCDAGKLKRSASPPCSRSRAWLCLWTLPWSAGAS